MAENIGEVSSPDSVVGFQNDTMEIIDRLTGGSKNLNVISIVGMAGLGKTTLAMKVYNSPHISYHFYVRAWISISQVYQKRNLLLGILSSPHIDPTRGDLHEMSDGMLRAELHNRLKGKRYLIVMDDIWDNKAWDDLRRCFPDDKNGSRIMLTTRHKDVVLNAEPYELGFLSKGKSWSLLHEKVFQRESCPPELMKVGKKIAEKCQGVPLAIVLVGGLLAKTEKTKYWWKQVAESIRSCIATDDPKHWMGALELSYNHLPTHLKPLFLYFGAFPEDYEIPVSRLIWLWIAEGFIGQNAKKKVLEDEAEDEWEDKAEGYLKDLTDRSLIIIASKGSKGGVKSCRIHDMLRDLCLRKVEEENFLQHVERYGQVSTSSPSSLIANELWRMCIRPGSHGNLHVEQHSPNICSFLCFEPMLSGYTSIFSQGFKMLRVLDLGYARLDFFPEEIEKLNRLRFLALQVCFNKLPPSISKLRNLETLIVKGLKGTISVDTDIYRMMKLRHLHIDPCTSLQLSDSPKLSDLQSLSTPSLEYRNWSWLKSTPNLRKLRCFYCGVHPGFEGLVFLLKLETLKMHYQGVARGTVDLFALPTSLTKITISNFRFDWSVILKISRLPNLEVLKLLNDAFNGDWLADTSFLNFEPFPKLKFLKFESLNIVQWKASSDYFPKLERLMLNRCRQLVEIPSCLGDIPTLETIELNWCSSSTVDSAEQILEEQREMGNELLKLLVYPPKRIPTLDDHYQK